MNRKFIFIVAIAAIIGLGYISLFSSKPTNFPVSQALASQFDHHHG